MKTSRLILFCISISIASVQAWYLGIENIGTHLDHFKNKSIALVANRCSLTQQGTPTLSRLQQHGFIITVILAPEHGFSGKIAAGKPVHDDFDRQTNIPIISLYEGGDKAHIIPQQILPTIEAIFFDLPHCGMRHYTYISTLYKLLELAVAYNIPIVIFDRPNPLGPLMEGPLVDQKLISFISIAPIPLRYGLSMGELARYFNDKVLAKPAPLTVIPLYNYQRTQKLPELSQPLSPNIPTLKSCYGYSFLGLLEEVSPFFAGNNTKKPFRYILLPEHIKFSRKQWQTISALLSRYHIVSIYTQLYRQRNHTWYHGLELNISNIKTTKSFSLLLQLLKTFKRFGVRLTFSPSFDKAVGTPLIRQYIQGTTSYFRLSKNINTNLKQFYQNAKPYFLYKPSPLIARF